MHQLPHSYWQGLATLCPEQLFCCPATGQADTRPASSIDRKKNNTRVNDFSFWGTCLSLHFSSSYSVLLVSIVCTVQLWLYCFGCTVN